VKVTDELRDHLREKVRAALGRFGRHIGLVWVYLQGGDGPRGGPGERCRIVVEIPPRGRVVVTEAATDIRVAIFVTANRARFAFKRNLQRRRTRRRPTRAAGPTNLPARMEQDHPQPQEAGV
jgi:hypothetical protein